MRSGKILLYLFLFISVNISTRAGTAQLDSLLSALSDPKLDLQEKGKILSIISNSYYSIRDMAKAIDYKKQAADIFNKIEDRASEMNMLEHLGVFYSEAGVFDIAIESFYDGLKISEELKDTGMVNSFFLNIGVSYLEVSDFDNALSYLKKSEEYFQNNIQTKIEHLIANEVNLGITFLGKQKSDSALLYYEKALRLGEENDYEKRTCDILINIGELHFKENDMDKALDFLNRAAEAFKSNKNDRGYWRSLYTIGKVHKSNKEFAKAIEILSNACEYFRENTDLIYLPGSYQALSEIYEESGNLEKALGMHKLYLEAKNDVINSENLGKMAELQMKYEIEKLEQENLIKLTLVEKQKELSTYKWALVTGILILLLIIILVLFYRSRTKKKILDIKLKNIQLEEQRLKYELDFKNKELHSFALHLVQKNDFLEEVRTGLRKLKDKAGKDNLERINNLNIQINQTIRMNKELDTFQKRIDQVNYDFFRMLDSKFSGLTEKEKRLCVLLKLDLASKEIATLNNISEGAVTMARYRLRKKMGLSTEHNLSDFLQKL